MRVPPGKYRHSESKWGWMVASGQELHWSGREGTTRGRRGPGEAGQDQFLPLSEPHLPSLPLCNPTLTSLYLFLILPFSPAFDFVSPSNRDVGTVKNFPLNEIPVYSLNMTFVKEWKSCLYITFCNRLHIISLFSAIAFQGQRQL